MFFEGENKNGEWACKEIATDKENVQEELNNSYAIIHMCTWKIRSNREIPITCKLNLFGVSSGDLVVSMGLLLLDCFNYIIDASTFFN